MARGIRPRRLPTVSRGARRPVTVSRHALGLLRRAGIKHKQTGGGMFRTTRTTITGRGRPPKSVFPRARFKWIRKLTF